MFGWTIIGVLGGGLIGAALGAGAGAIATKVTGVIGLSITKYSIIPIKKITLLGHLKTYRKFAKAVGAGTYHIANWLYNTLYQRGIEWSNNMTYLKDANSLGSQFVLYPEHVVKELKTLWMEIQYLIENGIPWFLP